MKPAVTPVLTRVYTRVDRRADERINAQLGVAGALGSAVTDEHLRLLLDAVSATNASVREMRRETASVRTDLEDLRRYVAAMEQRVRASRTELMYEMRYGGGRRDAPEIVESQVLNAAKLEQRPLRLNVGCGHIIMDDHVNVDGRVLEGVDVVADARDLPFEEGSVDELYNAHLIEHFPLEELQRVVLPHWISRLRSGGALRVVAPDAAAMIEAYGKGEMSFEDLRLVTYGEQEYDGDFHFAMYTPDTLAAAMKDAGLVDVEVVASGRQNGACLEMELTGVRA